jgi:hypothetical protein
MTQLGLGAIRAYPNFQDYTVYKEPRAKAKAVGQLPLIPMHVLTYYSFQAARKKSLQKAKERKSDTVDSVDQH